MCLSFNETEHLRLCLHDKNLQTFEERYQILYFAEDSILLEIF